jgi:hypothetical protein
MCKKHDAFGKRQEWFSHGEGQVASRVPPMSIVTGFLEANAEISWRSPSSLSQEHASGLNSMRYTVPF